MTNEIHPPEERLTPGLIAFGAVLILIAASYPSLSVWSANVGAVSHWGRVAIIALIGWAAGMTGFILPTFFGVRATTALIASSTIIFALTSGGPIVTGLGSILGLSGAALFLGLILTLVARIDNHRPILVFMVVAGAFVITGPAVDLARSQGQAATPSAYEAPPPLTVDLSRTPDVWLVVLDGYAGTDLYRGEVDRPQPVGVLDGLKARSFVTFTSAWSAYPTTTLSIPSMLDMGYVIRDGGELTAGTVRDLYTVLGGDNQLNTVLRANGYTSTMVESGWSGSRCGPKVDECVPSPFIDEAVFKVLERSMFRNFVLDSWGYAFTIGSTHSMGWALENAAELSDNSRRDFVFAHIMAPHPPLLLDGECQLRRGVRLPSANFAFPGADLAERVERYEEQVECVDRFMFDLAAKISTDAIVVFVSDHGTDRRNQVVLQPEQWSTYDLVERMNILLAIRTPDEQCAIEDGLTSVVLTQELLECLSGEEPTDDRNLEMFLYSAQADGPTRVEAISPSVLTELISSR